MGVGPARIETVIIDIPTIRPHVLAMATMRHQSVVLVRILGEDGVEGLGEGTTIGGLSYGDESPEGIKLVVGNHFAKCAVETALLDAAGKRLGVPVSELIGGGRVRDTLPVAWTLASGNTARDVEEAEQMLAQRRHRIFKLKIGKRGVREDVAHVAAIKKALGDRASVRVDVNQAWDEASADLGMRLLFDAGVDLIEQPVPRHALPAMVRLSARHGLPIMADEALRGPREAFALAAAGGARIFAVKIAQSGGLFAAREVAQIAQAADVGLYGGTMLEAAIGTAASAHVFATLPSLAWGTELFGPLLLTEEILLEPLCYEDFELKVPQGPGLGVTLDEARVAHLRRDRTASPIRTPASAKG
jgi:muconate cycloisomerase